MPSCFWNRCSCPTAMPCQEHLGIWCSRVRGWLVSRLADVRDGVVDAALAALDRLRVSHRGVEAELREVEERHRAWVERERAFAQRYQQVNDSQAVELTDEGRAIIRDAEADAAAAQRVIDAAAADLVDPEQVVASLAPLLQIPFSDPQGVCDCYRTKVAVLARLAVRITTLRTRVRSRAGALAAERQSAILLVAVVTVGLPVAGYLLLLSGPAGVVALLLLLLAAAAALYAQIVLLVRARAALLRAQIALLQAMLVYYRLQLISTCIRPFDGWERTDPASYQEGAPEDVDGRLDGYLEDMDAEAESRR